MSKNYSFEFSGTKEMFLNQLNKHPNNNQRFFYFDDYIVETSENEIRFGVAGGHSGGYWFVPTITELDGETFLLIEDYLKDASLYETVSVNGKDYLLTHSGLGNFNQNKYIDEYLFEELLWNRPKKNDRYYSDIRTIFGLSPTFFFGSEYRGKVLFTDTWIDINTGAAYGEHPVLFRLDDLRVFMFKKIIKNVRIFGGKI